MLEPGPAPFVAPLRIQRRTGGQRRHLPYLEACARELLVWAAASGDREPANLQPLRDSLWRSPYFREHLQERHLSPGDLRTLADLAHFPTLDRAALAQNWERLPALDGGDVEGLVIVRSSGTTAAPARVVRSERECLQMWAALRFWLAQLRLKLPRRPRVALFDTLPSGLEYSVRVPILDDGALHRISIHRPQPFERLKGARPAVVFTDPSGLHALLSQDVLPEPQLLLTSSQHFSRSDRARVAERLAAPILNYYATTETGPIAWECLLEPESVFHVMQPEVHVESIAGAIAVTRLRPSPLPLLRYLTGDEGEVLDDACRCGFSGRSIRGLRGRAACEFISPDGRLHDAWQLAWLFKLEPLAAFELQQCGAQRFILRSSEALAAAPQLVSRLTQALVQMGWSSPQVDACAGEARPAGLKPTPFTRSYVPGSASSQP